MPSIEYKVMTRQREEIQSLKARIAELERCVVMGGDGKPILPNQTVWYRDKTTYGLRWVVANLFFIRNGMTCIEYDNLKASDCYSSPDSVPE